MNEIYVLVEDKIEFSINILCSYNLRTLYDKAKELYSKLDFRALDEVELELREYESTNLIKKKSRYSTNIVIEKVKVI